MSQIDVSDMRGMNFGFNAGEESMNMSNSKWLAKLFCIGKYDYFMRKQVLHLAHYFKCVLLYRLAEIRKFRIHFG
jgi:hypothetical protein